MHSKADGRWTRSYGDHPELDVLSGTVGSKDRHISRSESAGAVTLGMLVTFHELVPSSRAVFAKEVLASIVQASRGPVTDCVGFRF